MELKKVKFKSAVFLGAFTLVYLVIVGALQLVLKSASLGVAGYENLLANVSPLIVLVQVPITGAVTAYIFGLIAILVYNFVAQKYPISWDLKK
jgi:hypothetical protein